jgi:hypothetical protein
MILEGAMIIIAIASLTTFHPGLSFAGQWGQADFTLRKRKGEKTISEDSVVSIPAPGYELKSTV